MQSSRSRPWSSLVMAGQVVGELVPGVQMRPLARVDLAELAVPVLQAPLEVPLSPRVAPLPVVPAAHIGRRLREVERPERGLDVLPTARAVPARPTPARAWPRRRTAAAPDTPGYAASKNW